ncbi:MAG: S4 domain-containing protein [Novosphingobium sp.]|uniref:RNA-binding S4 domain-containing protein n=1 Tax=Tsuneonella sp. CC-YZS046 TaxID=3042152 RepID=UPI002D7822FB|nr:S4 domain-containing protein [Tsuneonella sp. CC-YZS046]WRO65950.1 S4 domain-containing protein [Tsuneonella sp. CC-YZS046]
MRIDRLLWFLRFAKTRSLAQKWVEEGHIRRNGKRIDRTGQPIAVGDVLTLPLRSGVLVIQLTAIPARRGPPQEARDCYRVLDGGRDFAIAPARISSPEREDWP